MPVVYCPIRIRREHRDLDLDLNLGIETGKNVDVDERDRWKWKLMKLSWEIWNANRISLENRNVLRIMH